MGRTGSKDHIGWFCPAPGKDWTTGRPASESSAHLLGLTGAVVIITSIYGTCIGWASPVAQRERIHPPMQETQEIWV